MNIEEVKSNVNKRAKLIFTICLAFGLSFSLMLLIMGVKVFVVSLILSIINSILIAGISKAIIIKLLDKADNIDSVDDEEDASC